MRKVFFGAALAFACLAGTAASAGVLEEHGHSNTSWGGTGGYGVGGWKGNFSGKAATGETGSVTSGTARAPAAFDLGLERRDFERRDLTELRRDPDCIFVSTKINGARWRPGCK
jgi:opacity protein-like surface antigen